MAKEKLIIRGLRGNKYSGRWRPLMGSMTGRLIDNLQSCWCFCSTFLSKACTRSVWSTFSSHCPLSSNQGNLLTTATSIIFPLKFFWNAGTWTLGCWVRGKYATSVLCTVVNNFIHFQTIFSLFSLIFLVPFFIDPAWSTLQADFDTRDTNCTTVSGKYVEGET